MGYLPHFLSSLSFSLSKYISTFITLTLSLHSLPLSSISFSISCIDSKKERAPSLYTKKEDTGGPSRRSIFLVGEDISQILVVAVCHAHRYDVNWDLVLVFKPPKWRFPRRVQNVLAPLALKTF